MSSIWASISSKFEVKGQSAIIWLNNQVIYEWNLWFELLNVLKQHIYYITILLNQVGEKRKYIILFYQK